MAHGINCPEGCVTCTGERDHPEGRRVWERIRYENGTQHRVASTNAIRSAQEVAATYQDEPVRFAYWKASYLGPRGVELMRGDRISTWVGDPLGVVVKRHRPWRSNFGDRRQNVTVRTLSGREQHGTAYLSAGDYIRLRP